MKATPWSSSSFWQKLCIMNGGEGNCVIPLPKTLFFRILPFVRGLGPKGPQDEVGRSWLETGWDDEVKKGPVSCSIRI